LLLVLAGLAILTLAAAAPSEGATPSGMRLRALAGSFWIGFAAANNFWTLSDAATYQSTAAAEFNILTPENQMKWDVIHPQQNTYNFAPGDMHAQFAVQNGMTLHGHTLVWHNQNPGWLTGTSWTAAQLTAILNDHIDTVVGHYRGQVAIWDVVNEAFNEDGSRRSSIWQNTLGSGYIEQAFRRARAADPNTVLVYNDFNIEAMNAKSNAVFAMASDFKQRGVPIDGIGLQMHLTSGGIDLNSLASNMQRFANLGLRIYITEMDVRVPTPPTAASLQTQATIYQNVLDRCLRQAACVSLQMWGFTDKYSWVPGTFPGQGAALIFDESYNAKPAYFGLQTRLGGTSNAPPTVSLTSPAQNATFTALANVAIAATASDSDGTVAQVDFLQGNTLLGSDTTSPYTFTWNNVAAGTYTLTARARDNAGATTASAPVTITVGGGGGVCSVAYTIVNQWNTGFQGGVRLTNLGPALNGWTLGWTFPNGQAVTQMWGATYTQSGAAVTARNVDWTASIPTGGSVDIGFIANWSGTNGRPTAFTLNGAACSLQ